MHAPTATIQRSCRKNNDSHASSFHPSVTIPFDKTNSFWHHLHSVFFLSAFKTNLDKTNRSVRCSLQHDVRHSDTGVRIEIRAQGHLWICDMKWCSPISPDSSEIASAFRFRFMLPAVREFLHGSSSTLSAQLIVRQWLEPLSYVLDCTSTASAILMSINQFLMLQSCSRKVP